MELPPSPNQPVYLDNQATTRCDPRVLEVMLPWFSEDYGNPHSVEHVMGRKAEAGDLSYYAACRGELTHSCTQRSRSLMLRWSCSRAKPSANNCSS